MRRLALAALPAILGCAGGNAASHIATARASPVADEGDRRLVAAWPNDERSRWDAAIEHRRILVVEVGGRGVRLVDGCEVPGSYDYLGASAQRDAQTVDEGDELHAGTPWLRGEVRKSGTRYIDTTVVGHWKADRTLIRDDLRGDCRGATHFVSAADVGAFRLYAGASARVAGEAGVALVSGGASSNAKREVLTQAGDDVACGKAEAGDSRPPPGCSAPIRIELQVIQDVKCPKGQSWSGSKCADDGAGLLLVLLGLAAL